MNSELRDYRGRKIKPESFVCCRLKRGCLRDVLDKYGSELGSDRAVDTISYQPGHYERPIRGMIINIDEGLIQLYDYEKDRYVLIHREDCRRIEIERNALTILLKKLFFVED